MKLRSKIFYTYVIFIVTYLLLTLLPSPDRVTLGKYHLHPTGLRLLDLTIIIPVFLIWFASFYGYTKLSSYSQIIKDNQDGRQVAKLAKGLFILALGIPLSSLISSALALIARAHPDFAGAAVIIPNYFSIAYALAAFIFISMGARGLNTIFRGGPSLLLSNTVALIDIILGVVFCVLIALAHQSIRSTYHMPPSLVMLTFAIPYMYIWLTGLFAIAELYTYGKRVAGVLYRKAWNRLAIGLGSIVVINIALQYLETLSTWLNGLTLAKLLLLLYVLLFLWAGGFIVVALGTKELMKIEEA